MDNYFESILLEAILRCNGHYIDKSRHGFSRLYPFTTENIFGYIKEFDLENKSLLTVGSSGDQIINAVLYDCKDITLIDISPFSRFYFYLKFSAIITLNYNDFLNFFCYKDYTKFCEDNKDVFNINCFHQLKSTLRLLDYESYLFWDELFTCYNGEKIRKYLFSHDEYRFKILKEINPYIHTEENYYITRKKLKKTIPTFIIENIFETNLTRNYDNIWLSNLAAYNSIENFKKLIDVISNNLNDNGKLLVSYLYETTKTTKFDPNWAKIYNLEEVFNKFQTYNLELINFTGIRDIIFKTGKKNDSILLYKKRK